MISRVMLFLIAALTISTSHAQTHRGVPVEVFITKPDGSKLNASDFSAVSQVVTPNGCVLIEEFFSNLSVKEGYVTLTIGKGLRTSDDKGLSLPRALSNAGPYSGLNSINGGALESCAYQPSREDGRTLRLTLSFLSETVIAEFPLQSVPYAVVADDALTLQGHAADQFLKRNDQIGLNQLNFERMFSAFQTNSIPIDSIASATKTSKGVMQVGSGLTVSDGLVSIAPGGVSGSMIGDGIPVSKISGIGLLAYKNGISDLDVTGTISSTKIFGLGTLATKSSISDADVTGFLTASKISGLGTLATKNVIDGNDILGSIPFAKVEGLGTMATKNSVSNSDLEGNISASKIAGIGSLAAYNSVTSSVLDNTELGQNWNATAKTMTVNGNLTLGNSGQIAGTSNSPAYSGSGDVTVDFDKGNTILLPSNFACSSGSINLTNYKPGTTYSVVVQDTGTAQCNFKVYGSAVTSAMMKFSPANSTRPSGYHTIYSILVVNQSPVLMYTAWSSGFQ